MRRQRIDWLVGCSVKANCPLVGPGPVGEVSSVGVFLRDPSPYVREFRRNHQTVFDGCRDKANCPHVGPGLIGGVHSWGSF